MNPVRLGAVIVTFEPDRNWPARLAAVRAENLPTIVVDNSTAAVTRQWVRAAALAQGAGYLENPDNPGIGRALNQGFAALASSGADWALAFDQDSTPAAGLSAALLATAEGGANPSIAAVGSNWTDAATGGLPSRHLVRHPHLPFFYQRLPATEDLTRVLCVINSGTLFSLRVWRELGGFDETLFLDLVDSDYSLRALATGHELRLAAGARLVHARGNKQPVRFLGGTFRPAFMPAARLFVLYRNRLWLFKKHRLRPLAWTAYECVYALKVLADVLFLETGKPAKLGACLRGTLHGLFSPAPRSPGRNDKART